MTKQELRVHYKSLRAKLSENDVETLSLSIANQLLRLSVFDKNYFHLYLSIVEHKEVDTEYILQILQGKDKEVIISKSDFKNLEMIHYLLTDNTKIKKNSFNIPEPVDGIEVPESKIQVVFVPLLAFDLEGNRVGYGKGFYDRFLSKCKPDTIKIGLSFFEAVQKIDDVSNLDIKLDYCVTPSKIYTF